MKINYPTVLAGILALLPLITSSAITAFVLSNETFFQTFSCWHWLATALACWIAVTLAIVPPTFLAIVGGYFAGWYSLFPLLFINLAAIALINMLAKNILHDNVKSYFLQKPSIDKILKNLKIDGWQVVFFAKLSPVLPFVLSNWVFAWAGISLRNTMLGGFLGMIPRTVLAVFSGRQALALQTLLLESNVSHTQMLILGILLFISVVGLVFYYRKLSK